MALSDTEVVRMLREENAHLQANLEDMKAELLGRVDNNVRLVEQRAEIQELRDELLEYVEDAFQQLAYRCREGEPKCGWWDSTALSTACDLGNKLVELGEWERHPDGYGRRWFYRPIEKVVKAKEE